MNKKPRLAWELYLKMETSGESFSLLQLIANDCYKVSLCDGKENKISVTIPQLNVSTRDWLAIGERLPPFLWITWTQGWASIPESHVCMNDV